MGGRRVFDWRNVVVFAACFFALASLGSAAEAWRRVTDHLGSSVKVPASTTISHDGETVLLQVKDLAGRFWTITESRPGFPGNDPAGDMDLKRSDCAQWPPSYHIVKDKVAVYSCASGGNINYYIAKYGASGGAFLFLRYPKKNKDDYKEIVSRMSASVSQVMRKEIPSR